jgi:uncharacterized protein (TIGR03437 family)
MEMRLRYGSSAMRIRPLLRLAAGLTESVWDKVWGIVPLFLVLASAHAADTPALNVIVSNEIDPSGATVQIKLALAQPAAVSSGELALDLDPAFFGPVTAIATFSAAGDACGYATISGQHIDIHLSSPSASLGSAAGMPLVVITVPTLAGAKSGAQATITADPTRSPWNGSQSFIPGFPVTVTPGTVTIGGALSVSDVSPVSNLSSSAVVSIRGAGFMSATAVDIAGVPIASVQTAGPQEIDVTLSGPADLGGKRITVRNPDGSQVVFFAAPPTTPLATLGDSSSGDVFDGALPLFPTASYSAGTSYLIDGRAFGRLALANRNGTPVDVLLQVLGTGGGDAPQTTLTIPPGGIYSSDFASLKASNGYVQVLATAPLNMLELASQLAGGQTKFAPLNPEGIPPLSVTLGGGISAQFNWAPGMAPPPPQAVTVYGPTGVGFTVTFSTAPNSNWLSVTPTSGTTCETTVACAAILTVAVNPSGLAAGIYRGTVTITPIASRFQPAGVSVSFPVALTVTAAPIVNHIISTFGGPASKSFSLTPDMLPGAFTVTVATDSGGNWLSATPLSGTTPAQLTLMAAPGLGPGTYAGVVTVQGSGGNTLVIESSEVIIEGNQLFSGGDPLLFALGPGEPPSAPQTVLVPVVCGIKCPPQPANVTWTTAVATHSGGNWLQAVSTFDTTRAGGSVVISVNPGALGAGVYTGVVTLTSDQVASTQIPVALNVWSGPVPALVADPSSLSLTTSPFAPPAANQAQICTSTGNAVVRQTVMATTSSGGNWLGATVGPDVTSTCGISLFIDASHLDTGVHRGDVTIGVPGQTVDVPVTLTIPPPMIVSGNEPVAGSILNAASGVQGGIAPGEIISIHGIGIGPSGPGLGPGGVSPAGFTFTLDSSGHVPTNLDGTEVLFNGMPAPILFTSESQINAIVPYEAAGANTASVQVLDNGLSKVWSVPVAQAAPGIFTLDFTGAGPAAVLNQDNTVNGPTNPAARGSTIQIFATGIPFAGGVTGSVTPGPVNNATPAVSVLIGGVYANVQYAGPAPDEIAGLVQVNAVVPGNAPTGPAVPIVLNAASVSSAPGVTIAVQ